jgi:hypothetical protein
LSAEAAAEAFAQAGPARVGVVPAVHRRRSSSPDPGALPDLDDYLAIPLPRRGRPPKHDLTTWRVVDDWPADVPVTREEVDVFEAWFGDILDDLFDPDACSPTPRDGLCGARAPCRRGERK